MTSSTRPAFGPPRPPAPPRTVYDETSCGIRQGPLQISSMATLSNLVGYLEHPSPGTDGSFLICIAQGSGVFISEALYNSIPAAQRPDLNTGDAGKIVNTLMDGSIVALGSTLLPFVLTAASGDKIRLVLYSFVVPNFRMGMFISAGGVGFGIGIAYGPDAVPTFTFDFGTEKCTLLGKHTDIGFRCQSNF